MQKQGGGRRGDTPGKGHKSHRRPGEKGIWDAVNEVGREEKSRKKKKSRKKQKGNKRMKKMRRIASLLLALAMAFGLTATAFAAEVVNETGHTYAAYQVFKGTQQESVEEGDGSITALGDIEWGSGVDGTALLTELTGLEVGGAYPFQNCADAAGVAAVLDGESDYTSATAKAFANAADKHRTETSTPIPADKNATVNLEDGYYLFVDTQTAPDGVDAYNPALLQVTGQTITIKQKYSVPEVEKKVSDTEDGGLGDAVDAGIGDSVYFTLAGTLPMNWEDYDSYKYIFHDTLSDGLKYNGDVKVYLAAKGTDGEPDLAGKTEIAKGADGYTVNPDGASAAGGGTLTVTFADLKKVGGVTAESCIIVEYSATLTEAAVIGKPGNTNTVKLEYSNNPNTDSSGDPSDGTGETPEDTVYVFTYELDGTKVDGQTPDKTLKDAQFVLYRVKGEGEPNADGENNTPTNVEYAEVTDGKLTGWTDSRGTAIGTEDAKGTGIVASDENGLFVISGLDAGTYYLEEVKAPAGYNLLKDPVKLTIDAEISGGDAETNQPPTIGKLDLITEGKDGSITTPGDKDNGTVSLEVQNNMGALLPSTGGMGTTLFYIAGAALVLAAGVLFMMKRRTDSGK